MQSFDAEGRGSPLRVLSLEMASRTGSGRYSGSSKKWTLHRLDFECNICASCNSRLNAAEFRSAEARWKHKKIEK
jgi:hypothetical protein